MLDLTQLRTFVAVVQEGHLTRAAERLHMSQPTASNHIRALEEQFGVQLFHRTTRGLEATPAGLRLAEGAARVLGSSLDLTSLARELRGVASGRLSLGTISDPRLLARLPDLVTSLKQRNPLLEVNVEARNSLSTKQGIRAGELDAGFFVGSVLESDLDGSQLETLDYVVAGPHDWRDRLPQADWQTLAAMPWIVTPSGTSNAELTEHMFRPRGLKTKVALEVNNDLLLRAMITGGVGIGFVRREIAEAGAAQGQFCIAPRTACTATLLFGFSRTRGVEPVVKLLAEMVRAGWAEAA